MNVGFRAELCQSQRSDAFPTEMKCSVRHTGNVETTDLKLQLWPYLFIYVLNFTELSSGWNSFNRAIFANFFSSSSSSSSIFHGIGPLVDPFRSNASRSLFNGLSWFLLPIGKYCFIIIGNLLRGILFTRCIQFLLYSCSLSRIGVIFNSFAICVFVLWSVQVYPAVLLMYFISAAIILLASLASHAAFPNISSKIPPQNIIILFL